MFLTLASITTKVFDEVFDNLIARLSGCWIWDLKCWSLLLLNKWKEKWFEKQSIILLFGENSGLRELNEEKTLLKQLSILTKWPLIRPHWYLVRELSESGRRCVDVLELLSISKQKIWLVERECTLSYDLLLSFCKCKWIGIRPAIASTPNDGAILKAPTIYKVALLWSFPRAFKGYDKGALL